MVYADWSMSVFALPMSWHLVNLMQTSIREHGLCWTLIYARLGFDQPRLRVGPRSGTPLDHRGSQNQSHVGVAEQPEPV